MYILKPGIKGDKEKQWALPDRVFFACGACQVLAAAFLDSHAEKDFSAQWIRPAQGFRGNHIFVTDGKAAFDYHGYATRQNLLDHIFAKARRWWPGWDAKIIPLPREVLTDEKLSKTYDGLWLRQPDQFLHNAMPRAQNYLERFDHA